MRFQRFENGIEKVAVLGLDGLGWSYLSKILRSGYASYLKHVTGGSHKYILEAYPPMTPPSWTSIMTSVNPGKHGIFGFDYIDFKSMTQKLYTVHELEHPRIHEMLAMMNISSIMINPIPSFPVVPLRNLRVASTLFAPKPFGYPEYMKKYADRIYPRREKTFEDYLSILENYLGIVEELAEHEWRLFWITLPVPDHYLHKNPYLLKNSSPNSFEKRVFSLINSIARILDQKSDVLIIVSDHGFKLFKYLLSINDVLYSAGLLEPTLSGYARPIRERHEISWNHVGQRDSMGSSLSRKKIDLTKKYIGLLMFIRRIVRRIPSTALKSKLFRLAEKTGLEIRPDPRRSIAFMFSYSSFGIYVNLPEYMDRVVSLLESYNNCIKWVRRREDVYWGPYVSRAPHLMIMPDYDRDCLIIGVDLKGYKHTVVRGVRGEHDINGVLTVKLPRGYKLVSDIIKIPNYVVTALIMKLLGVPLPARSDALYYLKLLGIDLEDLNLYDYVGKWLVAKKLWLRPRASEF